MELGNVSILMALTLLATLKENMSLDFAEDGISD